MDSGLCSAKFRHTKGVQTMSKWYETASFYHIYPLGLLGAPAVNPCVSGETDSESHRLRQLIPWLDHMEQMSCSALYIGPLFESTAHGYDTIDYKKVDSRLGDNDDFKRLVEEAHKRGIRVVVDGVFNHTGRDFFAFKDIRANRENSPYRWWYRGINFGWNSAYNDGFGYESWRNCEDLVCLNLQNREVKDYLFDVIRFWIHEFDIDGIRLDCADCLDFDFLKEMRWMTGNEKEDFWLMGEVIHGDYSRWVNDEMLHSVTNYELSKGLWSGHNSHNYFEIAHTIRRQFGDNWNRGLYEGRVLYTFADNHDVSRLASRLNERRHTKPVYALVYTLPGVPSVYYGSEWGIEGRKEDGDPALRPAVDLETISRNPPIPGLEEFIAQLGKIRKENPVIAEGKYRELLLTCQHYAFARMNDHEAVIVACNNEDTEADLWIQPPIEVNQMTDLRTGDTIVLEYNQLHIRVAGNDCALIRLN